MTASPFPARRPVRAALAALAVVLAVSAATAGAHANDSTLFLVRDVAAKGEGKTDRSAQRSAAFRGAPAALRRLLRRLTARSAHRRLPRVSARAARAMVQGIEVVEAKRRDSAKGRSFDGKLSFLFDPKLVGAFLDRRRIAWSSRQSDPVLVLPVWRDKDRMVLWDGTNPWRDAWGAAKPEPGLVPIVRPEGGLKDLQAIDAAQAAKGVEKGLRAIAANYDAQQVLVAVAQRDDKGRVRVSASVFVLRAGQTTRLRPVTRSGDTALADVVAALSSQLEERWKRQVIVPAGPAVSTQVVAQFDDIGAWTRIQESLDAAPAVTAVKVVRFSAGEAVLALTHKGSPAALAGQLRNVGLLLRRTGGAGGEGGWTLRVIPKKETPAK